ncbi:MAG: selenocysteine-specific translation elongation factor [Planctomycetota bacterium]|jgi:selenocysteine-specific elongation factor
MSSGHSDSGHSESGPPPPLTIGTAGHIDHGKTLLIEQLTGMRADRPFERERGMTIDIGYAEMRAPDGRRIGFVDLPGHERFIRNMVAGATGIDIALMVVAADDGVMPQTREHMEILDLLDVRQGIVVLNKIDLVDEETRELAEEELREELAGSVLENAPIIHCSAATGEGIDALRERLFAAVAELAATNDPGAFFCGVQRSFAAAGFGCIVTGVPSAGTVAVGDEVELLPAGEKARVRAIEIYHEAAQQARAGHRTALNLSGVHHEQAGRGMVVAAPGSYRPARHIAVDLRMLHSVRRPLRHASPVRFLSGTLEGMATVYLLEGASLEADAKALVEIRTKEPITVRDGAAFIIRTDNAKETLGGGRVVASLDKPIGRRAKPRHAQLGRWATVLDDPRGRIRFLLEEEGAAGTAVLAQKSQLAKAAVADLLGAMQAEGEIVPLPGGAFTTSTAVTNAATGIRDALRAMHKEQPLIEALPIADVRNRAGLDEAMLAAALAELGDEAVAQGRTLRHRDHSVTLDRATEQASRSVLDYLERARFAPAPRDRVAEEAGLSEREANEGLTYLSARGEVREVAPGIAYARSILDEGLRILSGLAQDRGHFEPVQAKNALGGISRKWLIPLLEYYDKIGATRRDGNLRKMTNKGRAMAEGGIDVT